MTDLIKRLISFKSALARLPGNAPAAQAKLVGEAIAEIERLNDEIINIEALAKERYCAMQTEIERLQTEVRQLTDDVSVLAPENDRLRAESDTLRCALEAALLAGADLEAEIERLQAALESIATMPPVNEEFGYQGYDADKMAAIARDVLKGADDE